MQRLSWLSCGSAAIVSVIQGLPEYHAGYLAERLARYLPLGAINRMANGSGLLQRIYQRVVPVNLHDSTVIILAKTAS